jgi:hypothetical protein
MLLIELLLLYLVLGLMKHANYDHALLLLLILLLCMIRSLYLIGIWRDYQENCSTIRTIMTLVLAN